MMEEEEEKRKRERRKIEEEEEEEEQEEEEKEKEEEDEELKFSLGNYAMFFNQPRQMHRCHYVYSTWSIFQMWVLQSTHNHQAPLFLR